MTLKELVTDIASGAIVRKILFKVFKNILPLLRAVGICRLRPNKIVFSNFAGSGYGCNPKYIAEYILKNKLDFELVWLVNKQKCPNGAFLPEEIRSVKNTSFRALYELATASIWIDNSRKSYFPSKSNKQLYIQTWHGTFPTKKIEAEAKLPEYYVKNAQIDSKAIDYLISSSKARTNQFKKCFWYNGRILEIGNPRDDIFFDKEAIKKLRNKIHSFYNIEKDTRIILYVPTFRNSRSLTPYTVDFEGVKIALSERFDGNWSIIMRLHPAMAELSNRLDCPNYVINASTYPDMQELLCSADVVLTDFSSIGDYSLYYKPVFLFCTDFDEYMQERGFYFDLKNSAFPFAENNSELIRNIRTFDEEQYRTELSKYYAEQGLVEEGNASKRIIEIIEDHYNRIR